VQLTHHTVLITGGSSGIGLALAERFRSEGNEVIVCGRRPEALQAAQAKVPGLHTFVADTGSEAARVSLWTEVVKRFPKVDVLVNNAGIQKRVDVQRSEPWQDLREEIGVNLEGPIHLSLLAIPHLLQQAQPAILNVSSGLAFAPAAWVPIYCATKAALHSFTLSLRHQLRKTPIEVIEIIPPAVQTNLGGSHDFGAPLDAYADSVIAQLKAQQPEVTYQSSADRARASRAELDQYFKRLNGD
jgi:uncharacterized oxidoreductase